jgi:membrane-associated phospholipid phosphatase
LQRTLTFTIALASLLAGAAPAQQTSLRFKVGWWPDGVIAGAGGVASLLPVLWPNHFAHATCSPCDPSNLWGIDRGSAGPVRNAANAFSYGTSAAETGLGLLFLGMSRRGEGSSAFWEDAAVVTQAVSVTAAATMALKVLLHRPRPLMYVPGPVTPDDGRGFPSSHTSISFAVASAYASILSRRGIAGQHKLEIATLLAVAATTGVLRVVAREHFPTDVVAGAVLGLGVGWIVPKLHATLRRTGSN